MKIYTSFFQIFGREALKIASGQICHILGTCVCEKVMKRHALQWKFSTSLWKNGKNEDFPYNTNSEYYFIKLVSERSFLDHLRPSDWREVKVAKKFLVKNLEEEI